MAAEWCVEAGGTGTVKTVTGRAWEDELVGWGVYRSLKKAERQREGLQKGGLG